MPKTETVGELTEPLVIRGVSVTSFLVKPNEASLHFVGWTTTWADASTPERRITLRFDMTTVAARLFKRQLVEALSEMD